MDLYLGIDLSTQSISACVYNSKSMEIELDKSIAFSSLPELKNSKMDPLTLLFPLSEGQAEQDPMIFVVALERLLEKIHQEIDLQQIQAVQFSAQQHGHVYLNKSYKNIISRMDINKELWENLKNIFSYSGVPIWRSSDTSKESGQIREHLGGKEFTIKKTGSDSPLRFTGAIIKKLSDNNKDLAKSTSQIMLLNTFLASVFSGNPNPKVDIGNGSGMSLMDYSSKMWIKSLNEIFEFSLNDKFGDFSSPLDKAGNISSYFVQKYGFSENCIVGVGTGDNPATKVLCSGDLLSLGTSFVYMKQTDIDDRDYSGVSNAMYDGLGHAFTILCRTNGAMVWDKVRSEYHKTYQEAHLALVNEKGNYPLGIYQIEHESVPISSSIALKDLGTFDKNYKAVILSSLCLLKLYTENFSTKTKNLSVTGGATNDLEIVQLIANIWQCTVMVLPVLGASLGAALMAVLMVETNFELTKAQAKLQTNIIKAQNSEYEKIQQYELRLKEMVQQYLK